MEESKPVSFQGDHTIASSFMLTQDTKEYGAEIIGFKVDGYDKSQTLVIDPTLSWATYLAAAAV